LPDSRIAAHLLRTDIPEWKARRAVEIAQQIVDLAVSCVTLAAIARALVMTWRADNHKKRKEIDGSRMLDHGVGSQEARRKP